MSKRWKVAMIIAALAVAAFGAIGTYAWFSDTATLEGKTFATGTVKIRLEKVVPPWRWWPWPRPEAPIPCAEVRNMKPGDTITFRVAVESVGTLPLDYTIEPSLQGPLAEGDNPCYISEVRVDEVVTMDDSLSAEGGDDPADLVEIDITMPIEAGSEYEGESGQLVATFSATQQE